MTSVNQTALFSSDAVFEERLCGLGLGLGEPLQTQPRKVKEEEVEEKAGLPGKLHMEGGPAQKTLRGNRDA